MPKFGESLCADFIPKFATLTLLRAHDQMRNRRAEAEPGVRPGEPEIRWFLAWHGQSVVPKEFKTVQHFFTNPSLFPYVNRNMVTPGKIPRVRARKHSFPKSGNEIHVQEIVMLKKATLLSLMLIGMLTPSDRLRGVAAAQRQDVPKPQDKLALGENETEKLLLLIGTDKSGKITKQAWMTFMEAEFDRLDKGKSGALDPRELAQSRLTVIPSAETGK